MKILAVVGILFWAYCAVNVINQRRVYAALGEYGKAKMGTWAVFIVVGLAVCFWLLLR